MYIAIMTKGCSINYTGTEKLRKVIEDMKIVFLTSENYYVLSSIKFHTNRIHNDVYSAIKLLKFYYNVPK